MSFNRWVASARPLFSTTSRRRVTSRGADLRGLDHADAASVLARGSHERRRHGTSLDWLERTRHEGSEPARHAFRDLLPQPQLGARAEEERRPNDCEARIGEGAQRLLEFALYPVVEVARFRARAERADDEKVRAPVPSAQS